MRYLIIGLGIYGSNLARDLTDLGHEVICADLNKSHIDAIKDYVTTTYILDSCDPQSLGALPLKNVDLVIVAIGENFGASIKTVALLRSMGVRNIYARAVDELHQAILEGLAVARILTPEQRAAKDLVIEMELGADVDSLRIDSDTLVASLAVPEAFFGIDYSELQAQLKGLRLVAASRPVKSGNLLGLDRMQLQPLDTERSGLTAAKGDRITLYGTERQFRSFFRAINP